MLRDPHGALGSVMQRYQPGAGTLRLIVLTDGHDTLSPGAYHGLGGMDPLMHALQDAGYDVEWHIVVLGQVSHKERYEMLARATGGSFLAVSTFDEHSREATAFLDAIDESSRGDAEARRKRQKKLDARTTKPSWFKLLG